MKNLSKSLFILIIGILFFNYPLNAQSLKPLSAPINDAASSEKSPSLSADGKKMVFVSDRLQNGKWKIFGQDRRIRFHENDGSIGFFILQFFDMFGVVAADADNFHCLVLGFGC